MPFNVRPDEFAGVFVMFDQSEFLSASPDVFKFIGKKLVGTGFFIC
jgi:hypothetical protein